MSKKGYTIKHPSANSAASAKKGYGTPHKAHIIRDLMVM
jgi:hypothetical protein